MSQEAKLLSLPADLCHLYNCLSRSDIEDKEIEDLVPTILKYKTDVTLQAIIRFTYFNCHNPFTQQLRLHMGTSYNLLHVQVLLEIGRNEMNPAAYFWTLALVCDQSLVDSRASYMLKYVENLYNVVAKSEYYDYSTISSTIKYYSEMLEVLEEKSEEQVLFLNKMKANHDKRINDIPKQYVTRRESDGDSE